MAPYISEGHREDCTVRTKEQPGAMSDVLPASFFFTQVGEQQTSQPTMQLCPCKEAQGKEQMQRANSTLADQSSS